MLVWRKPLKPDSHIPWRSPTALKANSHIPCRSHAATLPRPYHSPNAGRSPTYRLRTVDVKSHIPCRSHAALCRGLERSLSERHIHGMTCVNQARPHCVNQMRKTQSKLLAKRHGRGTAWHVWISLSNALPRPRRRWEPSLVALPHRTYVAHTQPALQFNACSFITEHVWVQAPDISSV
jgi:hypothetical protein